MNKAKIFFCFVAVLFFLVLLSIAIIVLIYEHTIITFGIAVSVLYVINACFGFYILNSKYRQDSTKLCWLFIFILIPFIGVLIFLIFGSNYINIKEHRADFEKSKAKFSNFENLDFSNQLISKDTAATNIFKYSFVSQKAAITNRNSTEIIEENQDLYSTYMDAIRQAKHFIHFRTYIIRDGMFLFSLASELIKKAKEGVKVRFMYDWVGSYHNFSKKVLSEMKAAGVEIGIFNPKGINMFKGSTNFRSHEKCLIIDNVLAVYGSSNIGDEYLGISPDRNAWKDLNYILKGEIVNSLNITFCIGWMELTDYSVPKQAKTELEDYALVSFKPHAADGNEIMQLTTSSPNYSDQDITRTLVSLITYATKSIKIVTPYLFLTPELHNALKIAIYRRIDIKIIVPGKNDSKDFILALNKNNYYQLQKEQCKVYTYNGFIHSKYVIVDDKFVYTGTNNLDFRSLWINFESCLLIENEHVINSMNKVFENDLQNSTLVTQESLNEVKKLKFRISMWILNVYKPLL